MSAAELFLNPSLGAHTQDLYLVRASILKALRAQLPRFSGDFLDVGCGNQPYRKLVTESPSQVQRYIGMDLKSSTSITYGAIKPDLEWDGTTIPLADASVQCAMATEVLEHCPDPLSVLREVQRVLVPGGVFFFTVPFLWPLHDIPYDEYRYTPFALHRLLQQAGFDNATVEPMGGWDASLAQMIGLWVSRRPMPNGKRRVLKRLTLPVVRWLISKDTIPSKHQSAMITGLWGVAHRPKA